MMSVCMFLIGGQRAGPIGTNLGVGIHLDLWSVLGKSGLRSECCRCENGFLGADRDRSRMNLVACMNDRGGANAVGVRMVAPEDGH